MKKVIFLLGFVVGCVIINAQVPQDFNYQAIVCNAAGEAVVSHAVYYRFSIIKGTPPGTVVYGEKHGVKTNQVWLAENLKTTKYRNCDLIGTTTPATLDISGESTPKYQWAYDGNESNVATFGR